jgi:hypothetical protein
MRQTWKSTLETALQSAMTASGGEVSKVRTVIATWFVRNTNIMEEIIAEHFKRQIQKTTLTLAQQKRWCQLFEIEANSGTNTDAASSAAWAGLVEEFPELAERACPLCSGIIRHAANCENGGVRLSEAA